MSSLKRNWPASLALLSLSACWAQAEPNSDFGLDAELTLGGEYSTNVHVKELEQASDESDTASLVAGQLKAHWRATEKLKLDLSYSLSQKRQQRASQFDNQLQLMSADLSYAMGDSSLGGNFYHARAELADLAFMELDQASVYGTHFLTESWFLRASLTRADKHFVQLPERDAQDLSLGGDMYFFQDSGKRFVSVGVVYGDEDARAQALSFRHWGTRLRWSSQSLLWSLNNKWQLGWQWDRRDYGQDSGEPARNETHNRFSAGWEIAFNDLLSLETKLEYADLDSTLETADYSETRSAMALKFRF